MSQRTALWAAAAMTAFVAIMVGAVTLAFKPSANTQAETVAPAAAPAAAADTIPLTKLSADQAAQIALNIVPNGTLARTPELVSYQGTVAYEVMLNQGAIYIDANSSQILYNGATAVANNRGGERSRGGTGSFNSEQNEGIGGHDD